jgi:carboxymethylenebutenolidase
MAVKSEWIRYGDQVGYFAAPEKAALPLPGVVVIQEVGGVNQNIEDITRRIAAAGYAALAPDLFTVNGVRPEALSPERISKAMLFMRQLPPGSWTNPAVRDAGLAKLPAQDNKDISETFAQLAPSPERMLSYLPHLRKAFTHLKHERPETREQKVACVGFCMGGGLSALLACEEPDLSGAAVFYGTTPPAEKIQAIKCPVIGFYGGNDQRVNTGIPLFEEEMRKAGKSYESHVYDGSNHAFFNDDGPVYNVKAVRDAFARLVNFFLKTLNG